MDRIRAVARRLRGIPDPADCILCRNLNGPGCPHHSGRR